MEMALQLSSTHRKALRSLDVQALYLFGGRALGAIHPSSDYDYAVLLKDKGHQRGDATYMALYELLCEISPRTLENDVIDIVFVRDVPLELAFHVIRHGKLLYDADSKARLRFEEQITMLYCDYRPMLDEFDRTILNAL